MCSYAVVQFITWGTGTSVLAVPEQWLVTVGQKLKCFFPKSNTKRAIKEQYAVRSDWKQYDVKRLSNKLIMSYDEALRKESKALTKSSGVDSDSVDDMGRSESTSKSKRKKRRPSSLDAYVDDDEDTDSLVENIEPNGNVKTLQKFKLPNPPNYMGTNSSNLVRSNQFMGMVGDTRGLLPSQVPDNLGTAAQVQLNQSMSMVGDAVRVLSSPVSDTLGTSSYQPLQSNRCMGMVSDTRGLLPSQVPDNLGAAAQVQLNQSMSIVGDAVRVLSSPVSDTLGTTSYQPHQSNQFMGMVGDTHGMLPSQVPDNLGAAAQVQLNQSMSMVGDALRVLSSPVSDTLGTSSYQHLQSNRCMGMVGDTRGLLPSQVPDNLGTAAQVQLNQSMSMVGDALRVLSSPVSDTLGTSSYQPLQSNRCMGTVGDTRGLLPSQVPDNLGTAAQVQLNQSMSMVGDALRVLSSPVSDTLGTSSYQPLQSNRCMGMVGDTRGLLPSQVPDNLGTAAQVQLNQSMSMVGDALRVLSSPVSDTRGGLPSLAPGHFKTASSTPLQSHQLMCQLGESRSMFSSPAPINHEPNTSTPAMPTSLSGKMDFLIQFVAELKDAQVQLKHSVEQLLDLKTSNSAGEIECEDFGLPVDNEESMDDLENTLKDKHKRGQLRRLLARQCGRTLGRGVLKVMKSSITHRLASSYTLLGKSKRKRNFSSSPLYKVITQVALRAFPSETQDNVNYHISSYLRHAPAQPGCPKHKKQQIQSLGALDIRNARDDSE